MDHPAHLDPSQELPPPPEEKLLRAPTFWEKNTGKINWLLLFLIIAVLVGGWFYISSQSPRSQALQPTATMQPASPTPRQICGGLGGWACDSGYICDIYSNGYKKTDPPRRNALRDTTGRCIKEESIQPATTLTCTPRPACLDATPRCMIPETADMCPQNI